MSLGSNLSPPTGIPVCHLRYNLADGYLKACERTLHSMHGKCVEGDLEYSVHCIFLACFGVPHRQVARSSVRQHQSRTSSCSHALTLSVSLFRRAVPRRLPAAGTTTLKILRNGKETREIHKIAARSRPIPAGTWDLQTRIYPSRFTPGPHMGSQEQVSFDHQQPQVGGLRRA